MDVFIAEKNEEKIIVVRKKKLLIQEYPNALEARNAFLELKKKFKEEGYNIQHIFSTKTQPQVRRVKKIKLKPIPEPVRKIRVLGYKVVNNDEEN